MQRVLGSPVIDVRPLASKIDKAALDFARFAREPFRIFFPVAIFAGILGVALWPLHLLGIFQWYPGQIHARLMANGFFGGFILGFLGTAVPRMLSVKPLRIIETSLLMLPYLGLITAYALGNLLLGDLFMLCVIVTFATLMLPRASRRKDIPPPGFVLVILGLISAFVGAALPIVLNFGELDLFWTNLQRLFAFQGAILFPVMGVAPFILPRFFGARSSHDFPETLVPSKTWVAKAFLSLSAGILVIFSFLLEAAGRFQVAYAMNATSSRT